jgi:hypothetical protein
MMPRTARAQSPDSNGPQFGQRERSLALCLPEMPFDFLLEAAGLPPGQANLTPGVSKLATDEVIDDLLHVRGLVRSGSRQLAIISPGQRLSSFDDLVTKRFCVIGDPFRRWWLRTSTAASGRKAGARGA